MVAVPGMKIAFPYWQENEGQHKGFRTFYMVVRAEFLLVTWSRQMGSDDKERCVPP